MAVHHITKTMTGAAVQISATSVNVQQLIIENETGNADVKVGGSAITSTDYGMIVEAGPSKKSPPLTGTQGQPINLNSVYLLGTDTQKVHILYVG